MPKRVSYLSEISVGPKLFQSLQAKYLTNIRFVILLIFAIVIVGVYGYINIPRRLNPEINIAIVSVSASLPGANPKDVESLVTIPLEDKVKGVKSIDTVTSVSAPGLSVVTLQFLTGADKEKARNDVQSAVDTVALPTDVKTPRVSAFDFENQPVWMFAVTTKKDRASLMRFSTDLKKRLEDDKSIQQVTTTGFDTEEVEIIVDPAKVSTYAINPGILSQTIAKALNAYPSGSVTSGSASFSLSIDPMITSAKDIRETVLSFQDKTVQLGDIAQVVLRAKPHSGKSYYANEKTTAQPSVGFSVFKTSTENIDTAEKAMKKVVDEESARYHHDFQIVTVLNTGEEITKQFNELTSEFFSTIVLVFLNLFLFLGLRQAIISSLTVPLTLLSSIGIVNILGYSLNFLTSFAFLIALGLLIDDTIVTVAAVTRYYATGRFTPTETGLLVWRDFIVPLWSTTITTIWAFVPLLLASGIIGEFIKPIPVVVTITMLSSTTIAVLVTLPLMMVILKANFPHRVRVFLKILLVLGLFFSGILLLPKGAFFPLLILLYVVLLWMTYQVRHEFVRRFRASQKNHPWQKWLVTKARYTASHGLIDIEYISRRYMVIIERILSSKRAMRRTLLAIILFAFVSYLLVPLGLVKNEFFPKTDQDVLTITVDLPSGTTIEETQKDALALLEKVRKTQNVTFATADSGVGASAGGGFGASSSDSSFTITLTLIPHAMRSTPSYDIAQNLRDTLKTYDKGTLSVVEESGGPPAGADVQIKLLGDDLAVLDRYADRVSVFLKKQPGVTNIQKSTKPGTSAIVFVPDQNAMAVNGVSEDTVGLFLRSFSDGLTVKTAKFNNTDTDIVFYMGGTNAKPENVSTLSLPTQNGSVPLASLGSFRLENNPTVINRESQKRTVSVSASVVKGGSVNDINKSLTDFAGTLQLPSGYTWQTGGVNEQNTKSIQSMLQAMILSFVLILITMVIEFQSFRQAVIVLLTIPLAISGVFYVFALTGTPLSFPALIGILALFGIVVTTAIVIVEKINDNRKHGMELKHAIVDASGSRLEPILLTSISSILGLLPITLSNPLWRGLGGAIIAGLLFAGLIKLFFIPIVYYQWYGRGGKINKTSLKS